MLAYYAFVVPLNVGSASKFLCLEQSIESHALFVVISC